MVLAFSDACWIALVVLTTQVASICNVLWTQPICSPCPSICALSQLSHPQLYLHLATCCIFCWAMDNDGTPLIACLDTCSTQALQSGHELPLWIGPYSGDQVHLGISIPLWKGCSSNSIVILGLIVLDFPGCLGLGQLSICPS